MAEHERSSADPLENRLEFKTLISDLSSRFINLPTGEMDQAIEDALRRVCELLGLNYAVLWQWSADTPGIITPTHAYPAQKRLQPPEPTAQEDYPWVVKQMLAGQMVAMPSMEMVPAEAAVDRMTWAAGGFNDWLETDASLNDNATDWVGRATGLPWVTPDSRSYLHLGLGLRHVGSDEGTMRFSGRPESNVAGKYVHTGNFPADHAEQLSLEVAWQRGPFALLAEHVDAWVDAPESGDPRFSGEYAIASWVVTGESRPYVRALGYAGGIVPTRRLGAVELVLRYSHVNLTDAAIEGGDLNRWGFGTNWWLSAQWKSGVSYGDAELDKVGLRGTTRMLLARLQWMY